MHARLPDAELEDGMAVGLWWRPADGFEWRDDLKLMPLGEQTQPDGGPWLVPRSDKDDWYPVLQRPQSLLRGAERLGRNPTTEIIRRFADQRGPLGVRQPLMPVGGKGDVRYGESLRQWKHEVEQFAALRALWRLVTTRNTRELDPYVSVLPENRGVQVRIVMENGKLDPTRARTGQAPTNGQMWVEGLPAREAEAHRPRPIPRYALVLAAIEAYVHGVVNQHMRGHISPAVLAGGRRIRFYPDSLLSTIYWHFARELAGDKVAERECANPRCPNGGVFLPGRRDQRSCDANCRKLASYHRRTRSKSMQVPASRERP